MENEILNDNKTKQSANIQPQTAKSGRAYSYSNDHEEAAYDDMPGDESP